MSPRGVRDEATGRRGVGDVVRLVLRGFGQTLVTAGVVMLLFVGYEVYVTNYFSHRAQHKVHEALEKEWRQGTLALPEGKLARHNGNGIANIYIPRFGKDYAWTVVAGTDAADLAKGPGHYTGSQLPGQKGDFAVAGHRVGKGEPFLNLDQLRPGDPVVIETETRWFVYCVIGAGPGNRSCRANAANASLNNRDANGVPGREVVYPSQGQVILPVPDDLHAAPPYRVAYITMTTCTPKFSATQRMVVHGVLARTIAKKPVGSRYDNAIPRAIEALYGSGS